MLRRVVRREETQFHCPDGVPLLWRSWMASEPRRVVVLVHGLAEHSGRYDEVAAWWASQDTTVHAYDQRGHGRSPGRLASTDALEQLVSDLCAFAERVRKESGDLPLLVLGHSMGALVTLRALARGIPASAAITSGAALQTGTAVTRSRRWAARVLARIAPALQLATGIDASALSRDPQVVRAYREDPLVRHHLPVALGASLLQAMAQGPQFAKAIRVPLLLLHGESDALCPPQGSRAVHQVLVGGGHALRMYPGLRHEILNEPERETVLADALRWVEERGL